VYRWIEQEDPLMFARIKAMIRQGRWHVVNGMIVQPDMNIPQGESFARHFLLGKGYMLEHLGVEPNIAYCVDSFGHAVTLPQIFKKCGCDAYVFMRPGPHEMDLPAQAFHWQAPDGSRVLAFRITGGYGSGPGDHSAHIAAAVQAKPESLAHTMCFFGVGDHGGGPTIAQIQNIQALAARRAAEEKITFSSPGEYFRQILPQSAQLPVVESELYYHAVGCYAANSLLKRTHRKAECALLSAERMAALAQLLAAVPAPAARLDELWWNLSFNQFHDILGGCTIKPGADDAIQALGAVAMGAGEIANSAGRAIAAQINTLDSSGRTVVLFNPSGQPYTGYVEYEPWTGWEPWVETGWGLVDEAGRAVAYQLVQTDEALSKIDASFGICRLLWRAEIPAFGYRVYRFAAGLAQAERQADLAVTDISFENEHLRVELDPASGEIVSCREKSSGIELVGSEHWNAALILEDTSDTWSHGVTHFGPVIGRFGGARVRVCERGPLQVSLLVDRSAALEDGTRASWQQMLILRRGEGEVLVRNWLTWEGHFKAVKLAFDLAARGIQAVHHVPFGWTARPNDGSERANQLWVNIQGESIRQSGAKVGLALINDGKYSCDVSGSILRQTILRCPPYAYHNPPHTYGTKPRYDWLDQGPQEFTLVLRPHRGEWQQAAVQQRANDLNLPPIAVTQHLHLGGLPPAAGIGRVAPDAVELCALKQSEDGSATILRLAERFGGSARAELTWFKQSFQLDFAPLEVKTLRLTQSAGTWSLEEVDMLERSSKTTP
jgi:alpha-mannosidase